MALFATDGTAKLSAQNMNLMRTMFPAATPPATPGTYEFYLDTTGPSLKYYNGATWVAIGGGVAPVNPSVANNFVSFSDTAGSQKDSGKNAASFENALGNPTLSGMTLRSTSGGTRSWGLDAGGCVAASVSDSSAINTTETVVCGGNAGMAAIPANTLAAGATIRVKFSCTCTSTVANNVTFAIKWGTAGTTADTTIGYTTFAATNAGTNSLVNGEMLLTFRTVGASGTCAGYASFIGNNDGGLMANNCLTKALSVAAPNTTGADYISFTFVAAASTTTITFKSTTIEIMKG